MTSKQEDIILDYIEELNQQDIEDDFNLDINEDIDTIKLY